MAGAGVHHPWMNHPRHCKDSALRWGLAMGCGCRSLSCPVQRSCEGPSLAQVSLPRNCRSLEGGGRGTGYVPNLVYALESDFIRCSTTSVAYDRRLTSSSMEEWRVVAMSSM